MSMLTSINAEQRVYVLACGDGFTTLGFDYAHDQAAAVAAWLKRPELVPKAEKGTAAHYSQFQAAMSAGQHHNYTTGERCPAGLSPQLVGLEGWRVEVVTTYGEKRRFIVGKSTGWLPCHLELSNRRSSGGISADRHYQSVRQIRKER